jgi:Zn finger protein HypA/HybF involved in hydrogenase expression
MWAMSNVLIPILTLVLTMTVLFLLGLLVNHARVKRWRQRAGSKGPAVCRDCGHQGNLSYGLLSGKLVTSANIRLICEKCDSENWYVPGGKRDTRTPTRHKMAS